MTEALQTRTEHSRSLADAERLRAIETLKEVGLLISVSELETFHGRVGTKEEAAEWAVDPSFANGGNDSGNSNYNGRSTLYTAEKQVAKDFAAQRSREMIRSRYDKVFRDRVVHYTPEERQEWLDRTNKAHQEWYDGIDPQQKHYYDRLLDTDGNLKPKTFDDLREGPEARRLEREASKDEKTAIWKSAAEGFRAETHEIVTADTDATVLDLSFDEATLEEGARANYREALMTLVLPVTVGSPVGFSDRDKVRPFAAALQEANISGYVYSNRIAEIASAAHIDEKVVLQLASALNARHIAREQPSYLARELLRCPADIFAVNLEVSGEQLELPINLEYVQRYLREAHIVGVKQSISSATLNRDITSVSFFDLEKIITAKGLEAERKATWQRLGGVATSLGEVMRPEVEQKQPLLRLLEDVHVKPEKLVEAAKLVEGYNGIFEADAGNWEGFTLAEHTETVLRNFDENYADKLPVQLLSPMRLAILSHDLGKPKAAALGQKHRQKEYNVAQAGDFFDQLGIDERLKGLLLAVIGDGEELAFQIDVKKAGEPAEAAMRQLAISALQKFNNSEQVTDDQVNGFIEMCRILQICDGGAYTSMAITRREGGKGRHRNAPSFNRSFAQPLDLGKRSLRQRGANDKPAEPDLTPKTT